MKARLTALTIACILLSGCVTQRPPRATATQLAPNNWAISGANWEESWMKVRYLMGEQKATALSIMDSHEDPDGTSHMLIELTLVWKD
jgi:hypothetical protein